MPGMLAVIMFRTLCLESHPSIGEQLIQIHNNTLINQLGSVTLNEKKKTERK
jgi:hypothetical protein